MALKIVRNDITKMAVDAIVNTANKRVTVGEGCDSAVYDAAGYDELLSYRKEKIGEVSEGEVFITPGFNLPAKNIIHAVSPCYIDGNSKEEDKLRGCYRKALKLADEKGIKSIAFPLISTGSFGYPKEEGLRIALDEINSYLIKKDKEIYLTVFDSESVSLGKKVTSELKEYISNNYVEEANLNEYSGTLAGKAPTEISEDLFFNRTSARLTAQNYLGEEQEKKAKKRNGLFSGLKRGAKETGSQAEAHPGNAMPSFGMSCSMAREIEPSGDIEEESLAEDAFDYDDIQAEISDALKERMKHLTDTFSEYLLYLIAQKGLSNADVYKRAIVDKKVFSKIKNNPNAHPQKITALCLCVGAGLNLDETKDLLARAGYALSPCDKTDIIFSYFIENGIYDMIEIDIQLEEHGLSYLID